MKYKDLIEEASGELYRTMFEGENAIDAFLSWAPSVLDPSGRIVIGLNSLVGIQSMLERHEGRLRFELRDQRQMKLGFYNKQWRSRRGLIYEEIYSWRNNAIDGVMFWEKGDDILFNYEIVEARVRA